MTHRTRTAGRVLAASALTVGALPFGPSAVADGPRTDTKLAGFVVSVEASPLQIKLDDPELQVPRPTGSDVVEADPNYSSAGVSAGPNAVGVTSTLWPGNLFGTGLSQISPPYTPDYPIKGVARYPDKPYDTTGRDGGTLSGAHALGLDASAHSEGLPQGVPSVVTAGGVHSLSTATVTTKDVAEGTAYSAVNDVDLLGGTIHIGAVTTRISTGADGKKPVTSGSTTVSGLTIAGQAFSVDDKGLHAAGNGSPLGALGTPDAIAKATGISATLMSQSTGKITGGATRAAGGLVLKIDTAPLRAALSGVSTQVNPYLYQIIGSLPPQADPLASQLYYFIKASPNITFIFGSASSSSSATLPLTLPPFTFPTFPSTPGSVVPPGSGTPPISSVGPGTSVGQLVEPPVVTSPQGNGPAPAQVLGLRPASASASGAGLSALWVLGALAFAGLVGWGLVRFLGLAGLPLGLGCRLGAPTSVPNLRSVTA